MTLGELLKIRRLALNIPITKVASACGVEEKEISDVENGHIIPWKLSYEIYPILAKLLKTPLEDLYHAAVKERTTFNLHLENLSPTAVWVLIKLVKKVHYNELDDGDYLKIAKVLKQSERKCHYID